MKRPGIELKRKTIRKEFFECKRCKINSNTRGRMIPCPRGGCEAEIIGDMVITTIKQFIAKK